MIDRRLKRDSGIAFKLIAGEEEVHRCFEGVAEHVVADVMQKGRRKARLGFWRPIPCCSIRLNDRKHPLCDFVDPQ